MSLKCIALFWLLVLLPETWGCLATGEGAMAPLPCTTCVAPPLTDVPPGGAIVMGAGTVTEGLAPDGVCKQFTVTCNAAANRFVVIGANQAAVSLSQASAGEKTATLTCNDSGELEGMDVVAGGTVIVMSVYCSNAT